MTVLNVVLVCLLHERITEFLPREDEGGPGPPDRKKLLCLEKKTLTVLQWGSDFFYLILYVPSTIFQLYRDRYSGVEPVLS